MSKTIAVCGAGPGWAYQVARKYAQEGYQVALISRTQSRLEELSKKLQTEVPISLNKVKIFVADLVVAENVTKVVAEILSVFGSVDVVYSGIVPAGVSFVSATNLTAEYALTNVNTFFLSAINLVQAFLPSLLAKQSGSIVFGAAVTAARPLPNYSGPGPAMAALRQYLLTLNLELKDKNIFVGIVMIGGMIVSDPSAPATIHGFPTVQSSILGDLVHDVVVKKVAETSVPL